MFDRIKTRLGSEEGFTLIELLVVIIILGILVAIAVPSYLSLRGNAEATAAQANVRSAIPAAETYYQQATTATPPGGGGSYTGMTGGTSGTLQAMAPGIAPSLKVGVLTGSDAGEAYCLEDTQGSSTYSYLGGDSGASGVTLGSGDKWATIQSGSCATDTGITAS